MTVDRRLRMSDITVMVAGQGGDGSLTVANLLGQVLASHGLHIYTARSVASRIKGGRAAALMRGSTAPRHCLGDHVDLLVAFDPEAVIAGGPRMNPLGVVVVDTSAGSVPDGVLPDSVSVYEMPFARLAVRDLRRDLFKNSVVFGMLARILGESDDVAAEILRAKFGHRRETLEGNLRALQTGFDLADTHGLHQGGGPWELVTIEGVERILISGNEAVAFGFIAAGGRFFSGYPITPASEILDFLGRHLGSFGGTVVQAEDELSAINMAIGAALTGTRAMTASSGPGISLMQEGVSHAGSAEIPLVIVDCQRAGPSTGMPTKPEQSDLNMLVHGGNGDFPRIVLAPGDPSDCFELAVVATNLSQELQIPVYLALDQAVSQDAASVAPFDVEGVCLEPGRRAGAQSVAELSEYRRYLVTEDGVSPWAVPGTPAAMSLVTGNERDEWGQVATAAANRVVMMDKRMRKLDSVRNRLPEGIRWGDCFAEVGLLGIGMESGVMREAAERLKEVGLDVECLQPRTLWPVPVETLSFIADHDRVFVIEHNAEGQLAHLLSSVGAPHRKLRSVLRYDGVPFRPGELADRILGLEGRGP